MSFNASKCEVIRVSRKRNPIKTTYTIHGHDLTVNKTGKYLGVTIADNLTWNAHVDATAKKANNSLAFLRRSLASCPRDIKAQSYQALVRPILEYASTSWDPHTKSNIQQLEAVQRRAARFVTGDYRTTSNPSQMIADLKWEPLYQLKGQLQTGNGVPHHVWTYRHSSATVSASISIEHSRPHFALHDSLLQDRCLLEFIFPISNQAMEPVAGDYCSCLNP